MGDHYCPSFLEKPKKLGSNPSESVLFVPVHFAHVTHGSLMIGPQRWATRALQTQGDVTLLRAVCCAIQIE